MGELILCRGALAAMPFFLESISINIYSLEELAWCMREHAYLVGLDIYCEEFAEWVGQELKQEKLSEMLSRLLEQNANIAEFGEKVISAVGYCDSGEREEICKKLQEYARKTPFEREIIKADSLLLSGNYKSSISAYEGLTKRKPTNKTEELLLGKIWHNMGTAYARLFFFEQAVSCYQKAYEINQSQVTGRALLTAHSCMKGEMERIPEDPEFLAEWSELQEIKSSGDTGMYQERLIYRVNEWKKEYIKSSRDR